MIFRPATLEDFIAFFGQRSPVTFRGVVAERDGIVVGIAGYYPVGSATYVFTNQRGMTKKEMVKAAREVRKMIDKIPGDIIAKREGTDTFLRHFGFEPCGEFYRLDR